MTSPVIFRELTTVMRAVVCGAMITFVYDFFRIFRRVLSHNHFWIGIEDLIFWIGTTVWIFSVLYRENDGSFRMYTILAMVLGMVVYSKVVSGPFVKIFSMAFRWGLKILGFPLKMLKIYIIFPGKKLKKNVKASIMSKR